MFTDEILNAFSRTLAQRFAANALGSTPGFDRLIGRRPGDQILAGFLTPRRNRQSLAEDGSSVEEEMTQDLPEDEPYEQTNIGLEWLTPFPLVPSGDALKLEVKFSVFVRELPTYNEALENARWQIQRLSNDKKAQYTSIIPVWTRHPFPPITVSIRLDSLGHEHSAIFDLSEKVRALWAEICGNISGLFPRR
ncbi:MAG: hypothetical protein MN733_01825 [Nitrososphaera sp.]|nr:hypothetical protein [Nitrososphaera sp.]